MIEPLESRIAPAAVFPYTDVDGDKVKVTLSAGLLMVTTTPAGNGAFASFIDVSRATPGADLTVSVTKVPGGDGLANVGYIYASVIDLGNVTVKGDLGQIDCGDGDPARPALKSLNVRSMGRFGTSTQTVGASSQSDIVGALGTLKVAGDVQGAYLFVNDGAEGTVGSVTVGGSVIGGAGSASGVIYSTGDMGPVKIGRDLIGGDGVSAGQVGSATKVASVTIGRSVIGGGGNFSGLIYGGTELGPVKIGRDLVGGSALESGIVKLLGITGKIGNVTIGGSIFGGTAQFSGGVYSSQPGIGATTALANVAVGGWVFGGLGERSGAIYSHTDAGAVSIRGDLIGGAGVESGQVQTDNIKSVSVGGSVVGGSSTESGQIEANDVAGSITVGGSLRGGGGSYSGVIYTDSIGGKVVIKGSLIAGSITADDVKAIAISGDVVGPADIEVDNVGSIAIGGSIVGTDGSASVTVDSIGALTVKGSIIGNPANAVSIFVRGPSAATPGFALGSLTVGGNVEHTLIEVGTSTVFGARNGTIGAVKIAGDWIATSIASGIVSGNGKYGDGDDALIAGAISRIASITIGGAIIGTQVGADSFAFTAHEIGAFTAHGLKINLEGPVVFPGAVFSFETGGDVKLREL